MDNQRSKILACVDGSTYLGAICDYAAWAAQRTSCSVELLHVVGRRDVASVPADFSGNLAAHESDTLLADLVELDAQKAKLSQRRGRALLEVAKDRVAKSGLAVETRLRNGDLIETVVEEEQAARLVVIGKRGEASEFASSHLGSNLERVVRASPRPVLIVPRDFAPIRRLLVAYDGGPSSERALAMAIHDPLLKGLDCHILKIGEGDAAQAKLDDAARRLASAGLQVTARLLPHGGMHTEEVISAYVLKQGIDLVVMGAYGHSRIRYLVIGSTTTAMLRAANVPVLMVQ